MYIYIYLYNVQYLIPNTRKERAKSLPRNWPRVAGLGGSKKTKVKNWKGALSNPIPFVKRSSEQFLFLL